MEGREAAGMELDVSMTGRVKMERQEEDAGYGAGTSESAGGLE
jgi:hypothetical protein